MGFAYYLPELLFGALAVVAVIWLGRFLRKLYLGTKGKSSCIHCKGTAEKEAGASYLFLIPVHFGEVYENPEEYLLTHMAPIEGKEQIPTGMRACRLEVYRCSACDRRQVEITDFLNVRGEESVKGSYEFPYEPFRPLIEAWKELSMSSRPGGKPTGQIHGEAASVIKGKGEF